jgi:hypothetical protein
VGVRLQPPLLAALDKFVADEKDDESSRPQAIRLILDDWLKLHSYLRVTVDKKALPKAK